MKYPDKTYHLLLDGAIDPPGLYIVGFRPNEIPIKNFKRTMDSITFERADFYSEYRGAWTKDHKGIKGVWTGEEKDSHILNFSLAQRDSIKGVNPKMNPNYQYTVPLSRKDFAVASLQSENVDEEYLKLLFHDVQSHKFKFIHSLLISRNNKLVFEDYFYNMHGDVTFGIQSVTKSFVSALVGIAIERKEIGDINDPLCKYLTDYKIACNDQNATIRLSDVLSMSTGLQWDERTYDYGHPQNSLTKAFDSKDIFSYVLEQPRSSQREFAYNSMNHSILNKVLRKATRLSNAKEMDSRLIKPLGITAYDLGKTENGVLGDIFLTPREMMKFGLLYLNNGMFNDRRILSETWVKESTTEKISVKENLGYGYFWWTTTFSAQGKTLRCYFAWGYGGQYIIVVPELKLVVVMTGTNWSTDPEQFMMDIMSKYLVPACK